MTIKIETNVELAGDIFFKLVNAKNKELICRFAVNTAFIEQQNNVYAFDKKGVDPDSVATSNKIDPNFQIKLHFEDVCKVCKPGNPLN